MIVNQTLLVAISSSFISARTGTDLRFALDAFDIGLDLMENGIQTIFHLRPGSGFGFRSFPTLGGYDSAGRDMSEPCGVLVLVAVLTSSA
jgi:hypothetical protein